MANTFIIEVPGYVEEDEFGSYFRDIIDDLRPAMDLELEDDRAQIDEIEIETFALFDDVVHIEYEIRYSAYYGCKDMDYANEDQRVVSGQRTGRSFEFEVFVPSPMRSTFEEF